MKAMQTFGIICGMIGIIGGILTINISSALWALAYTASISLWEV